MSTLDQQPQQQAHRAVGLCSREPDVAVQEHPHRSGRSRSARGRAWARRLAGSVTAPPLEMVSVVLIAADQQPCSHPASTRRESGWSGCRRRPSVPGRRESAAGRRHLRPYHRVANQAAKWLEAARRDAAEPARRGAGRVAEGRVPARPGLAPRRSRPLHLRRARRAHACRAGAPADRAGLNMQVPGADRRSRPMTRQDDETIAALRARGLPVPAPHEGNQTSGRFAARVPRERARAACPMSQGRRGLLQRVGAALHRAGRRPQGGARGEAALMARRGRAWVAVPG